MGADIVQQLLGVVDGELELGVGGLAFRAQLKTCLQVICDGIC